MKADRERTAKKHGASPLSEEEAVLWDKFVHDRTSMSREALFQHYLPFTRRLAGRYFRRDGANSIQFNELVQLGCAGLLEAIDRYRPELGIPFRYFCNRRITGSILNGIAQHSEVNQQISFRRRQARERFRSLKEGIEEARSLDQIVDLLGEIAGGLALGLMIESAAFQGIEDGEQAPNAYETLAWKQTVALIKHEVRQLPARERDLMVLHYEEAVSFEQIGELFGVTKGRISQLHKHAIGSLRRRLLQTELFRLEGY